MRDTHAFHTLLEVHAVDELVLPTSTVQLYVPAELLQRCECRKLQLQLHGALTG